MSAAAEKLNPIATPPARALRILHEQRDRYEGQFYLTNRWRWIFRDNCRYRWQRRAAVSAALELHADGHRARGLEEMLSPLGVPPTQIMAIAVKPG